MAGLVERAPAHEVVASERFDKRSEALSVGLVVIAALRDIEAVEFRDRFGIPQKLTAERLIDAPTIAPSRRPTDVDGPLRHPPAFRPPALDADGFTEI